MLHESSLSRSLCGLQGGGTTLSLDCFAEAYVVSVSGLSVAAGGNTVVIVNPPGCSDPSHCGTFVRTASTCDGVPAYQQPNGAGNVLFRSQDDDAGSPPASRWNVSFHKQSPVACGSNRWDIVC